jgi:CHAT domain-containing protein/tetratricopeptide (TPR) repeat protein
MTLRLRCCGLLLLLPAALGAPAAIALEAPAACQTRTPISDESTPLPRLWQRIKALEYTDPLKGFDMMCGTLTRVIRDLGPDSLESARWALGMVAPLIAYLDRGAEAEPLLRHAQPILERRLGRVSHEVSEVNVAYAWMEFRRGNLTESAAAWTRALAIREKLPGPKRLELQKVLVGLAQTRMSQRRFAEARALAERSFAILRSQGESVSEAAAAIKNLLANIALGSEEFAAARDHARDQVAIELELRARGGPDQPVTAYAVLGQALQRTNEFDEAEVALRESVRLAETRDGPLQRSGYIALLQLSALLNERGDPRQAAQLAQRAIERGERELGAEAANLVPALDNLAFAQRQLGDLAQALQLYQRAAAIVVAHGNNLQKTLAVRHHRGYGQLLLQIGDRDAAALEVARAESLSREDPTLLTERAAALVLLASVNELRDPQLSRGFLADAARIYTQKLSDTHPQTVRALNALCGVDILLATPMAASCDEAAKKLDAARFADPFVRQAVLQNLSERAARAGDLATMQRYALESLAAAQTLATPDPAWRAHYQLARSLYASGQPSLAIFFGKQAVDSLQVLRRSLQTADARLEAAFLQDKVAVYRELANWLLDQDRLDEALEVLDLMKSEELAGFLRADTTIGTATALSRNSNEIALSGRLNQEQQQDGRQDADMAELMRRRETDRITPQERQQLENYLTTQREQERQRALRLDDFLRADMLATKATTASDRVVRADRLDRELRQLGRDTALAVFLLGEGQLRILIATAAGQTEHRVTIDGQALRRDIGALLDDVAAKRDISTRSQALYALLFHTIDKAATAAGARRIVLWPDSALRYLPFALLRDGATPMVDRYDLQLFAGRQPLAGIVSSRNPALVVRGLGVTQAVGGFSALPAVGDELCGIVRGPIAGLNGRHENCESANSPAEQSIGLGSIRGAAFADAQFTQQQFDTMMQGRRDFSVLHVSTHFSLRPGNALRSFLLLGDGERLTIDKLAAVDFTGIRVMTLSACQTALGGAVSEDGREVEGLSTLVQRRGVSNVLASLWRVDDRSTALLMKTFYRRLAESPGNSARALRLAQLELRRLRIGGRRPYEHPYFWAGFTLAAAAP